MAGSDPPRANIRQDGRPGAGSAYAKRIDRSRGVASRRAPYARSANMSFPLTVLAPPLHAALASHIDDQPQQHEPQIPDPIGPVISSRLAAVAVNPQPLPPEEFGAN